MQLQTSSLTKMSTAPSVGTKLRRTPPLSDHLVGRALSRVFPQPDGHLAASHLELEKTFRAAGRSSAKRLGSCCASRATLPYFPLTFRSATPSGVGACSSAPLPKSRVWMRVKHKKQT